MSASAFSSFLSYSLALLVSLFNVTFFAYELFAEFPSSGKYISFFIPQQLHTCTLFLSSSNIILELHGSRKPSIAESIIWKSSSSLECFSLLSALQTGYIHFPFHTFMHARPTAADSSLVSYSSLEAFCLLCLSRPNKKQYSSAQTIPEVTMLVGGG